MKKALGVFPRAMRAKVIGAFARVESLFAVSESAIAATDTCDGDLLNRLLPALRQDLENLILLQRRNAAGRQMNGDLFDWLILNIRKNASDRATCGKDFDEPTLEEAKPNPQ